MRNEVIVNGVTLTRKQIEDAFAELNKPEIKPGQTVTCCGLRGVTASKNLHELAVKEYAAAYTHRDYTYIGLHDGQVYSWPANKVVPV